MMHLPVLQDEFLERRTKVLNQTSASQVNSYEMCPRIWFNNSIAGLRSPPTEAQARGTAIHSDVEHYLKTGEIRESKYQELVLAAKPYLPDPTIVAEGDGLVEHKFELPTYDGGPTWLGFIDVAEDLDGHVTVVDHKSTSDFRYCKTPEELSVNTQMVAYAEWAWRLDGAKSVKVSHVYIRTRGAARATRVEIGVEREHVKGVWQEKLNVVREMMEHASNTKSAEDLVPNTESCEMYGGCAYKSKCGLNSLKKGFLGMDKTPTNGKSSLLQRLQKSQGIIKPVNLVPPPEPEPEPVVQNVVEFKQPVDTIPAQFKCDVPGCGVGCAGGYIKNGTGYIVCTSGKHGAYGIVPPDAPPRTSTPEEVAALTEPKEEVKKEKKPRKNKISAEVESAPVVASAEVSVTTTTAPAARKAPKEKPTLFVDCYPAKGVATTVLLEDWLGPISDAAALDNNVADVRLISYTSKGVLAVAIRNALDTCPPVLVISSSVPGSDVALEVLIPHAKLVVRALRG